jgi:kynurenine formamidase
MSKRRAGSREEGKRALSETEALSLHERLSNWGRWGESDQLGTLNLVTPEKRVAAARLVRSGRNVSCARALDTEPALDNPSPVVHLMTRTATEGSGGDYFAVAPHGYAVSHIDALCHIFHEGRLYNGYPIERVTAHGALELGIQALRNGVVSRGVLFDIPRWRGRPYLEPGEGIFPEDLEAAESRSGLRVESGDLLLVRTGRWAFRAERGAWDPHERLAGLHASCLAWLHERGVALLGGDGVSDLVPSQVEGLRLPIHSIAITAMGLHLVDNLDLETLAQACVQEGRSEFLLTIAPLVIERGTSSPVNPIALF